MKKSNLVISYTTTNYTECNIGEALLDALQNAPNHTLTLPEINMMRVNGNAIVGSYGHDIMMLRKKGHKIKTNITHEGRITKSSYTLEMPKKGIDWKKWLGI